MITVKHAELLNLTFGLFVDLFTSLEKTNFGVRGDTHLDYLQFNSFKDALQRPLWQFRLKSCDDGRVHSFNEEDEKDLCLLRFMMMYYH
jgi:hypothetical protein